MITSLLIIINYLLINTTGPKHLIHSVNSNTMYVKKSCIKSTLTVINS